VETAGSFSVVIPTCNRAQDLTLTLQSIAGLRASTEWEVVVVDNNSSDRTREVVEHAAKKFPVALRYVFEAEQGRSAALNAGVRASHGAIILSTDDDVRVDPDWAVSAIRALEDTGCDYAGGKVLPIWCGSRPVWLPNRPGRHWAVIALLDYGPEESQIGSRPLLGVNMAFRRSAFARAGLFDNRFGRKDGTLLGQEIREWRLRATEAGLKGIYAPGMVVHHVIPRERLTKRYFRSWFYWHGMSRAMLYDARPVDMEAPEETSLDFSKVPHVIGVPRYMFRTCLEMCGRVVRAAAGGDPIGGFESELWVWFFAGVVRQRWKDRKRRSVTRVEECPTGESGR